MIKIINVCLFLTVLKLNSLFAISTCSKCKCTETILDCSEKKLSLLPVNLNENKSVIIFEHNQILHIRQFASSSVNNFFLGNNYITTIDDSAFKFLSNLTVLDLSNNLLTSESLLPHVFRGKYAVDMYEPLPHLKDLNIANNFLHAIHPDLFEHIPNLEKLVLSGNPLKVISHGMLIALSSVPFLKELYLSNTSLESLPENVFHSPKYLHVLDLSYNSFKEPPKEIESSHALKWLSLNGNPFKRIEKFVSLPFLKVLHLSYMPNLILITNKSLNTLPLLEEFYCSDNRKLLRINEDVFTTIQLNADEIEEKIWPPIKVLALNNNSLRYLPKHLVLKWENLLIVNLQNNPWMCDCENQWLISTLTPTLNKSQSEMTSHLKCALPIEMKGKLFLDLYRRKYEMRCLDFYSHKPEKDGKLLIEVLILSLICTPLLMSALIYYKRKTYFYHRHTVSASKENLYYSQLKVFPVKN